MDSDEMITSNGNAPSPEHYRTARAAARHTFDAALERNDYFEAAKAIGVLEFNGQTDIDYFSGMLYQRMALELMEQQASAYDTNSDPRIGTYFNKVVEYLSKVPEDSEFFSASTADIEGVYRTRGAYNELDALLKTYGPSLSPIEELSKRVECLTSLAMIDPLGETACPTEVVSRPIDAIDACAEQQLAKFRVFAAFASALATAVECIDQCALYASNVSDCDMRFAEHEETAIFASLYQKCLCVLRCSRLFDTQLLPEGIGDLPELVLCNCDWSRRIERHGDETWHAEIAQACRLLCAPETHPQVDPYPCVERLLYCHLSLGQFDLSPIISRYLDVIDDAARHGSMSAREYLEFAYSTIRASGEDPSGLEEKLARYVNEYDDELDENLFQHAWLSTVLSPRSYDALVNAEYAYRLHESADLASRDASHLALMYFRVLEIEYIDRLVLPFIAAIDYDRIEATTGYIEFSKRIHGEYPIASEYRHWLRGLDAIYAIKTGFKKAMEIGTLRTILTHIHLRDDPCATILETALESLLTADGLEAYHSEKMMGVIGKAQVDEYRIPGAHIGFVAFTKAKEARTYATTWAPIVASWFVD